MSRAPRLLSPLTAAACFGAIAWGAWSACSIYDKSLLLASSTEDGGGDDAGEDSPSTQDGGACGVQAPPKPTTEDGNQDRELVFAIHTLDIGIRSDGGAPPNPPLGLDLDGVCTCPGPESCKARVTGATHCDDEGGRDNSGGRSLKTFAQVSGGILSQDGLNQRIDQGELSLLVRVRHYNGGANDANIELSIFISQGTPLPADGGGKPFPKWDGTDEWTIDSASVFGGAGDAGTIIPNFVDTQAYVADHVIVGSVDFPLTLGGGSSGTLVLQLTGSIVTARLVPEGSSFRIDQGNLSGRWATSKLLEALQTFRDPVRPGEYLCPGSQSYANTKALICKAADIFADPKVTDPNLSCDALSLGLGFTAVAAKLGSVVAQVAKPVTCPDAGIDDCQ